MSRPAAWQGSERGSSTRGDGTITSEPGRDAVGVLANERALRAALDELLRSGFDRSDIGAVAGRRSVERTFGAKDGDVTELEYEPEAPMTQSVGCDSRTEAKAAVVGGLDCVVADGAVGAVVASGGTPATGFAAAATAGSVGGLIGGARSKRLGRHRAQCVDQRLARGGLHSWLHSADRDGEARACQNLRRPPARDVHVYNVVHAKPNFVGACRMA